MPRVTLSKQPYVVDPRPLVEKSNVGEDASQPLRSEPASKQSGWKWPIVGVVSLLALGSAPWVGVVVLSLTGDASSSQPEPYVYPPAPPGYFYLDVVIYRTTIEGDISSL